MKVALITGSGRERLGFEIAKHLAARNTNIAIHYNSSGESAEQNVEKLKAVGVSAEAFQADVTDESEVRRLIENVNQSFGRLDILVTTSSIWKSRPLEETTADDVLDSFKVNTLGTFLCCKYAGAVMAKQEAGGNIITFGDSLIDHPYMDHAAYFAAKGSIPTLTKCLAVELAARNSNIRVNCIQPGPVMLPEGTSEADRQSRIESTLIKHADDPTAVARTVEFLIANPMLTGCCIDVDGGRNVGLENLRQTREQQ